MATGQVARISQRMPAALCTAVIVCALVLSMPLSAHGVVDDYIPGVPVSRFFSDSLTAGTDHDDVFRTHVLAGEQLQVTLYELNALGSDFNIYLYPTAAVDFTIPAVAHSSTANATEQFTYTAPADGWYYIRVTQVSGSGGYDLMADHLWLASQPPDTPERIWGSDRYTTAVEIAKKNFPGWQNCEHVILASGEDRAAADPLAASGLTWTYGGPIMLTQSTDVPDSVIVALRDIAAANGGVVTVHVVGGPVSIPPERLTQITSGVAPGFVIFDRIGPATDRYDLAAAIAWRMDQERPTGHTNTAGHGKIALIANGADPDKFFDALALSSIAAANGYPILLVEQDRIPLPTSATLSSLAITGRVVGGGPATVSDAVLAELNAGPSIAGRWSGADRYETAAIIANFSYLQNPRWLNSHNVAVTAKLPDALAGGAFAGARRGPVLITSGNQLNATTALYLHSYSPVIGECFTVGGERSVSPQTHTAVRNALVP